MHIVNSTTLRNNLSDTLSEVTDKKDFLLVSKKGNITSAIVNIDLFEDLLALKNKKYLKSIKKARQEYKDKDIFFHDHVFGDL